MDGVSDAVVLTVSSIFWDCSWRSSALSVWVSSPYCCYAIGNGNVFRTRIGSIATNTKNITAIKTTEFSN